MHRPTLTAAAWHLPVSCPVCLISRLVFAAAAAAWWQVIVLTTCCRLLCICEFVWPARTGTAIRKAHPQHIHTHMLCLSSRPCTGGLLVLLQLLATKPPQVHSTPGAFTGVRAAVMHAVVMAPSASLSPDARHLLQLLDVLLIQHGTDGARHPAGRVLLSLRAGLYDQVAASPHPQLAVELGRHHAQCGDAIRILHLQDLRTGEVVVVGWW